LIVLVDYNADSKRSRRGEPSFT